MLPMQKRLVTVCFSWLVFCELALAADDVDFNRDVRPILSNKCYLCHGPDESSREADLRLDSFDAATEYAIVPGDSDESELFQRIVTDDDDMRMPPAEHGPALTAQEKTILQKWIESGAVFDQHWSYRRPTRPSNVTSDSNWPKNEIDQFTLPMMERMGLGPANEANRHSLIRRVALDLTGLPPTPDETAAFVNDSSDDAYEKAVDRIMAKPAYGERWAAVWLDMARYADSMGFAEDHSRTIWAYRDYVIRSYNQNMPFDQFTIEQIAGDQLPDPTDDQIIATAFHRNTLNNSEGGTIDEEFRSAAVVDRVNTTMAVWMGTTIACAQCHTHKYDPITQKEYFQLYAFFNNTEDNDRPDERPVFDIYDQHQKQQRQIQMDRIAKAKSRLNDWQSKTDTEQSNELFGMMKPWLEKVRSERDPIVRGNSIKIEIPKSNAVLSLAEVQVFAGGKNVALAGTASQSSTAYDGPADLAIDDNTDGAFDKSKSVTHTANEPNPWWMIKLDRDYEIDEIVVWNRTDQRLHTRLDDFVVTVANAKDDSVWSESVALATKEPMTLRPAKVPKHVLDIVLKDDWNGEEKQIVVAHYAKHYGPEPTIARQIKSDTLELEKIKPTTTVPVMKELKEGSKRKTHVHHRGSYLDPGEKVDCGTPTAFHEFEASEFSRLNLAKWLVDKRNPLTARVAVNRLWQQLFGIGIVPTNEEFGAQGEMPSHPKLLDYLACEYTDSGWDQKHLLKKIVMSATYRQSSKGTTEKLTKDPNNRWLSRGPRFRLSAEMIRDQALLASGLLSDKMYGPPVQPPQPKTGLKFAFSGETADWIDSTGDDRYRRAIYTKWRRSSPYPSMATFDISNREVCELRRLRTNTPLQALVTLNDPVFIEAAQALARRIYQPNSTVKQMAMAGFEHALVRPASGLELEAIQKLYKATKSHFATRTDDAKQLATDPLNPVDEQTDMVELATWTTIANVILNLDEVFMKR